MTETGTYTPAVSVVILSHNGLPFLGDCLRSVCRLDYPPDRLQVMLVDNASVDGSPAWVRQHFPQVEVLQLEHNLGFAEGNNRGAASSSGEVLVFLNTDTRVAPDWLRELVAPLGGGDPTVVATASKMLDWEGQGVDFPVYATLLGMPFASREERQFRRPADYDRPMWLLFASGGAMAIRRQAFEDVGRFDGDYFMYHEDVDLGWRLWLSGYKVLYVPSAIVHHRSGGSGTGDAARRYFLNERNALYTMIKNVEDRQLARLLPLALLWLVERLGYYIGVDPAAYAPGGPSAADASAVVPRSTLSVVAAVMDLVRHFPVLLEKRRGVQARRVRSDEEIAVLLDLPRDVFRQMLLGTGVAVHPALGLLDEFGFALTETALFPTRLRHLADAAGSGTEARTMLECLLFLADHSIHDAEAKYGLDVVRRLGEAVGLRAGDLRLFARVLSLVGSRILSGLAGVAEGTANTSAAGAGRDLQPLMRESVWRDAVFFREVLDARSAQLEMVLRDRQDLRTTLHTREAEWAAMRRELQERLDAARDQVEEQERVVRGLRQAVAGLEDLLAVKEAALTDRERVVGELRQAAARLEDLLAVKEAALTDRDAALVAANQQIHAILDSLGYRLLEGVRRRMGWLMPFGTRRGRVYTAVLRGLRWSLDLRLRVARSMHRASGRAILRLARRALQVGREAGVSGLWHRAAARLRAPAVPAVRQVDWASRTSAAAMPSMSPLAFPTSGAPSVSILIPVHNQARHTYACLKAVLEHTDGVPYEVIVADDGSRDETAAMLRQIRNITVLGGESNRGFVDTCNRAARAARGDYLVLLNNDTEVQPGWLTALVRTADREPAVGVVGAKLIYPDGRLQEAGAIVWDDGFGWNYGRFHDPARPEYNFVREVDYCSGACLLVRRSLWAQVGGFDPRFAPAYYEDTDLAFAVRSLGHKIVYQPRAAVVHAEGASHGTDVGAGIKQHQTRNRLRFVEKWREVLAAEHHPSGTDLFLARHRHVVGRILVADHYVPHHDRDSGSQRMFFILRLLRQLAYHVTFLPADLVWREPYTNDLQQLGIEVLYQPIDLEGYLSAAGPSLDLVWIARPDVGRAFLPLLRRHAPWARFVYDTVDLHFLREGRRAALEDSASAWEAAEQLKAAELALARQCDATIVVSPNEQEVLRREDPTLTVHVLGNIHEVQPGGKSFLERKGLLFIGNFVHPPNEDAVFYFVEEIFPRIRERLPGVTLHIVGDSPTRAVRALAAPHIVVTGWVRDVGPLFRSCRVFVAPLRYGAGVKGKLGQSLSFGLPVVTTSVGAEGMGLVDGRNALIADTPDAFAQQVVRLHSDETLWGTLSTNSLAYVREHSAPEVVRRTMEAMLRLLLSPQRSTGGRRRAHAGMDPGAGGGGARG